MPVCGSRELDKTLDKKTERGKLGWNYEELLDEFMTKGGDRG